jgi:ornithine carbamoyltransferase
MGHSLMIVGCLMGMDVRICGRKQAVAGREFW